VTINRIDKKIVKLRQQLAEELKRRRRAQSRKSTRRTAAADKSRGRPRIDPSKISTAWTLLLDEEHDFTIPMVAGSLEVSVRTLKRYGVTPKAVADRRQRLKAPKAVSALN
jgi:hypothetical protein